MKKIFIFIVMMLTLISVVYALPIEYRHYTFNASDTSTSKDYGHSKVNSTNTGTAIVDGKIGKGLKLDAYADTLDFKSNNFTTLNNNSLSMSFWINFSSINTVSANFMTLGRTAYNTEYAYYISCGQAGGIKGLYAGTWISAASYSYTPLCSLKSASVSNKWYHVVMTYSGGGTGSVKNLKLYLNGSICAEANVTIGKSTNPVSTNYKFFGGDSGSSRACYYTIDDVRIFRFALNQANVTWLYNSTFGTEKDTLYDVNEPIIPSCTLNFTKNIPFNSTGTVNVNINRNFNYTLSSCASTANCTIYVNLTSKKVMNLQTNGKKTFVLNTTWGAEGTNSIMVKCVDNTKLNYINETKSYFQDTINPVISYIHYLDMSYVDKGDIQGRYVNYSHLIYTSLISDTNLYSSNLSLNGTGIKRNLYHSGLIPPDTVEGEDLDGVYYPNQKYTIKHTVCDAHTMTSLNPTDPSIIKTSDRVGVFGVQIIPKDTISKNPDLIYSKDRFKPVFDYAVISDTLTYSVISDKPIEIIKNSVYKCHMVVGNTWLDFENVKVKSCTMKVISKNQVDVIVTLDGKYKSITFNSIGKINCVSSSAWFYYNRPPDLTVFSKSPSNVNVTNGFPKVTQVWNISRAVTFYPFHITNFSSYYVDGVSRRNIVIYNTNYTNTSKSLTHDYRDNEIYGGTHNLNPDLFRNTSHSFVEMTLPSHYTDMIMRNVSSLLPYNVFEFMSNSSIPSRIASIYACNSSYTSGKPESLTNICTVIQQFNTSSTYGHCHDYGAFKYSCHNAFTFTVSSSKISNVKVTKDMHFIIRGISGSLKTYTIAVSSTRPSSYVSYNNGNAWSTGAYTYDAHLHQFSGTDTLITGLKACTIYGLCSNVTSIDGLETPPLAPSLVNIFSPINMSYSVTVPIETSFSESRGTYPISWYNIFLYNSSTGLLKTVLYNKTNIARNVSNFMSIGHYFVRVEAEDNQGYRTSTESERFSVILTTTTTTTTSTTSTIIYAVDDPRKGFDSILDMMLVFFLGILWMTSVICYFALKGNNGGSIFFFLILELFFGMVLGFKFATISSIMTVTIIMSSVSLFIMGMMRFGEQ